MTPSLISRLEAAEVGSQEKEREIIVATSSAQDGVYVISRGADRRCIGKIRAERSLVEAMCAAPDLMEALEEIERIHASEHRTIDKLILIKRAATAALSKARTPSDPSRSEEGEGR